MILRAASREDFESVRGVLVEWWDGRDLTALMQPLFLDNFASTSLIAEDDGGELAGFLVGFPSVDDPSSAYVHFVAVAPAHRSVGLGRRLHDAFAEQMSSRGVTRIRCVTSPVNESSIAFHQRIGFEVEERDAEYVHFVRRCVPAGPTPLTDPRPDDAPWPTAQWPMEPSTVLTTAGVTLRLADQGDARELFEVLDHDACWAHVRGRPESDDDVRRAILGSTEQGRWMWVVERSGSIVGTTSFLEVSPPDARLEIGFTVYAPSVWASEVNPACKWLLMSWAFDHGFGRVQLKTDIRNERSQRAIARLGATYEGVLRRYQRRQDGSVRDTVVFSVTAEEWPAVQAGLSSRLVRSVR